MAKQGTKSPWCALALCSAASATNLVAAPGHGEIEKKQEEDVLIVEPQNPVQCKVCARRVSLSVSSTQVDVCREHAIAAFGVTLPNGAVPSLPHIRRSFSHRGTSPPNYAAYLQPSRSTSVPAFLLADHRQAGGGTREADAAAATMRRHAVRAACVHMALSSPGSPPPSAHRVVQFLLLMDGHGGKNKKRGRGDQGGATPSALVVLKPEIVAEIDEEVRAVSAELMQQQPQIIVKQEQTAQPTKKKRTADEEDAREDQRGGGSQSPPVPPEAAGGVVCKKVTIEMPPGVPLQLPYLRQVDKKHRDKPLHLRVRWLDLANSVPKLRRVPLAAAAATPGTTPGTSSGTAGPMTVEVGGGGCSSVSSVSSGGGGDAGELQPVLLSEIAALTQLCARVRHVIVHGTSGGILVDKVSAVRDLMNASPSVQLSFKTGRGNGGGGPQRVQVPSEAALQLLLSNEHMALRSVCAAARDVKLVMPVPPEVRPPAARLGALFPNVKTLRLDAGTADTASAGISDWLDELVRAMPKLTHLHLAAGAWSRAFSDAVPQVQTRLTKTLLQLREQREHQQAAANAVVVMLHVWFDFPYLPTERRLCGLRPEVRVLALHPQRPA